MSNKSDADVTKEVVKIQKKLEKIVSKTEGHGQAKDLLNTLRDIPVTLDVLTKTRIGLTVNSLRKSSTDDDVINVSKGLIKHWKKLLENKNEGKVESSNGTAANQNTKSNAETNNNKPKTAPARPEKPVQKVSSYATNTSDDVRLKCRDLVANALKVEFTDEDDDPTEKGDPDEIAARIEECIFKEFKNTDQRYKNRIRSRVANLKDQKNPDLRSNVLRGAIAPEKIAVMTAEEMASKEMKSVRQRFTKEAINDHQMSVQGGTKTDLLKCPKCRKSNCTYNQVQTRSADEPMTTFCLCNECGKRWKFC
ncbi:Transcription elongation factor A protein 1 [Halotydeus destructor]|nr:Transcription elongation factor A protein 1 [Halotydeus destructor]